mmetsp:Transcript_2826/g.4601  ORF Transcript_2826/g.4601 Transcript_2826/m.4601 type:complete len:156 (-) Transcript_2826:3476-3943(-)
MLGQHWCKSFYSRKGSISAFFFKDLITRHPQWGILLAKDILNATVSARSTYLRVEAMDVLNTLLVSRTRLQDLGLWNGLLNILKLWSATLEGSWKGILPSIPKKENAAPEQAGGTGITSESLHASKREKIPKDRAKIIRRCLSKVQGSLQTSGSN